MKNRTVVGYCALVLAPFLSLSALADTDTTPGTNTMHGQAQRTSGEPGYGLPTTPAAAADAAAPAAAAAPVAVVTPAPAMKPNPCAPIALSPGAVGLPCETQVQFIKSLGLSPKATARAIAAVNQAASSLAH